ncbi:uncharacterized protein DUF222 [Mumia flava]|uniref:Uncharacterized protein DUF222 n=1 Tax=Mumia flava TaxID=1348852 RepID=A0A0B2BVC5_9ACTN|nr:DUF222 domain-containing protein [Mumia flava]PJJ48201.1 uncharacterized protein DUF222 [Mumia flava]
MFESVSPSTVVEALRSRVVDAVDGVLEQIAALDPGDVAMGAAEVEVVALCERLVRVTQATQTTAVAALEARRRAVTHVPQHEETIERSLRTEVAMARQVSASASGQSLFESRMLQELPSTAALFEQGAISVGVVREVCREVQFLSAEHRARLDSELAESLGSLTPKRAGKAARRLTLALDPHAGYVRTMRARGERQVSLTRELDTMATLRVYGPAEQLAAAYHALDDHASARRADGDPRTVSQLLADTALERLTGAAVDTDGRAPIRTEISLLMRPETLFGTEDTPAVLDGYGAVPAELARELVTDAGATAWIRRLFTRADGQRLSHADPRRRRFPPAVARLVRSVDAECLRPWCDCRARDIDHRLPHHRGGPSTGANADPACRGSNQTKEAHGWRVTGETSGPPPDQPTPDKPTPKRPDPSTPAPNRPDPSTPAPSRPDPNRRDSLHGGVADAPRVVTWTTPTGHRYTSTRPGPHGHGPTMIVTRPPTSPLERRLCSMVRQARLDHENADARAAWDEATHLPDDPPHD